MLDWRQYRQDFLWFSYFGITEQDARSDAAEAMRVCIRRAFRDLSRTLDYTYSESSLKGMDKAAAADYRNAKARFKEDPETKGGIVDFLAREIERLLEREVASDEQFDTWHDSICGHIIHTASHFKSDRGVPLFRESGFTYGQAQKWVNMTLKNMLIMGVWDDLEAVAPYMHIPLDSYIFSAAMQAEDRPVYDGSAVKGLGIERPEAPWSNLDNRNRAYSDYQNRVREKTRGQRLSPIEWEGPAWIAQAKAENGKNK